MPVNSDRISLGLKYINKSFNRMYGCIYSVSLFTKNTKKFRNTNIYLPIIELISSARITVSVFSVNFFLPWKIFNSPYRERKIVISVSRIYQTVKQYFILKLVGIEMSFFTTNNNFKNMIKKLHFD